MKFRLLEKIVFYLLTQITLIAAKEGIISF